MVEMRLEVDIIPVADVDRAKEFYSRCGWRLDEDVTPTTEVRLVQFTPPGSACSITFGTGLSPAAPRSAFRTLVLSAIVPAHCDLVTPGLQASDTGHVAP